MIKMIKNCIGKFFLLMNGLTKLSIIIYKRIFLQVYSTYLHLLISVLFPVTFLALINRQILKMISRNDNYQIPQEQDQVEMVKRERGLSKCYFLISSIFVICSMPKVVAGVYDIFAYQDYQVIYSFFQHYKHTHTR
jgi:hypothetical protein